MDDCPINISIVITTFNAAAFIKDTLTSIIEQTYPYYEIIIVDDGSTDKTMAIIKTFMLQHPKISIKLLAKPHIGRGRILNEGIQLCAYDWIAIIDADDLWHRKKLELQVSVLREGSYQFLATKSQAFTDVNTIDSASHIVSCFVEELSLSDMLLRNLICHSSVLAHKSLLQYDTQRKTQIDHELWLRLLANEKKLYLLSSLLTYHRIHAEQNFESKMRKTYLMNAILLQLRFSFAAKKWLHSILITGKIIYYFFPRRVRLKLRTLFSG